MIAVRGQQQQLQKTLQEKQHRANQLNAQIEKLIAEEVARQEREAEARRRAEAAERSKKAAEQLQRLKGPESSKKTEETASSSAEKETPVLPSLRALRDRSKASEETFNLSKNFAANKGKLPLPCHRYGFYCG